MGFTQTKAARPVSNTNSATFTIGDLLASNLALAITSACQRNDANLRNHGDPGVPPPTVSCKIIDVVVVFDNVSSSCQHNTNKRDNAACFRVRTSEFSRSHTYMRNLYQLYLHHGPCMVGPQSKPSRTWVLLPHQAVVA